MSGQIDDAKRAVHTALEGYLDDGEIAVGWVLTIDVAGPDGTRYLAHRAGGGHDGTDMPTIWTVLGMCESASDMSREQLREMTVDVDDHDQEDDEP